MAVADEAPKRDTLPPSISSTDVEEIRRLHEQGLSQTGIAVYLGVSQSTISQACRALGLVFDSRVTQKAARAMAELNYERRQVLQSLQYDIAIRAAQQINSPTVHGTFGGKDNTWNEVNLDHPIPRDQLALQQIINGAVSNLTRLEEQDNQSQRTTINLILATAEKLGLAGGEGE